jgi:glucose-6-phosphate isomerase
MPDSTQASWIPPIAASVELPSGRIPQATRHYQKHFADLAGLYEDETAFDRMLPEWETQVVYEVWEHKASTQTGDLIFGTSVMSPGTVGREFFMTSGHQHQLADRAETYFCLAGSGVMLLESPDGEVEAREWQPGVMVYVPPHWIHRSVNTGSEPLITLFTYSADAGQNYDLIRQNGGMRQRVMQTEGGWRLEENSRYCRPSTS